VAGSSKSTTMSVNLDSGAGAGSGHSGRQVQRSLKAGGRGRGSNMRNFFAEPVEKPTNRKAS
jgi:hypothetical protein